MLKRPRRSVLYMPGSNSRVLEKAKSLAVDALIFDLEDAVAPDAKEQARDQVCQAVYNGGYAHREVIIRVNGLDTEWGEDDLKAVAKTNADALLLPKISKPDDIAPFAAALNAAKNDKTRIWIMVETPLAILNIGALAAVSHDKTQRLEAFVMGTNDLAKDTGVRITAGREALTAWLSQSVAAARSQGLTILDGVYNHLETMDGFVAECEQGRIFGMDGKTLIHPKQIAPCNQIFSPSQDDVDEARAILAAFEHPENQTKGAITVNGRMVERLHAQIAAHTVAIAETIAIRE